MYLFEQIFQYLDEYYFSASLGSYDNFEIESTVTLLMVIGGLCLGMMIASVAIFVQKKHVGKMVRALLAADAYDKDSAKTLAELGLKRSALIKMSLSQPSALRKLLTVVEGGKCYTYLGELAEAFPEKESEKESDEAQDKSISPEKKKFSLRKIDFENARFFIDPALKDRAENRFSDRGSSIWMLILSLLLILFLFFAALRLTPFLVRLLDATITNFRGL